MKVLLTLLFVLTATFAQAQSIIKSLERNIPGQGKVTIHQDPRIEALIGMERPATGEQKVIKTSGSESRRMPVTILVRRRMMLIM